MDFRQMASNCNFDIRFLKTLFPAPTDTSQQAKQVSIDLMAGYLKRCGNQGRENLNKAVERAPREGQPKMRELFEEATREVFTSKK